MDEIIARLKLIKKDDLDEREFYEQIIDVIKDIDASQISEQERESIKSTLHEIGCEDFEGWIKKKKLLGYALDDKNLEDSINKGSLLGGVWFANNMILPYISLQEESRSIDPAEKKEWAEAWLNNSRKISKNEKQIFDGMIDSIKSIDKSKLSERRFFEEVLGATLQMKDIDFTEYKHKKLQETLFGIGCENYKDWEDRHLAAGEEIPSTLSGAKDAGSLYMGASCINQFLCGYETALLSYEKMIEGGDKHGSLQQWLRASKAISAEEEKDTKDEDIDY